MGNFGTVMFHQPMRGGLHAWAAAGKIVGVAGYRLHPTLIQQRARRMLRTLSKLPYQRARSQLQGTAFVHEALHARGLVHHHAVAFRMRDYWADTQAHQPAYKLNSAQRNLAIGHLQQHGLKARFLPQEGQFATEQKLKHLRCQAYLACPKQLQRQAGLLHQV